MRDLLVAGNWKMNGNSGNNARLIDGLVGAVPEAGRVHVLVCPPFPYLASVAELLGGSGIALGAQNVSEHAAGAYTGEVSGTMLRDVGCEYVIVGHSERRSLYSESSAQVAAKFIAAQAAGLTPVLCVGETLDQRKAGTTESVIDEQLGAVLDAAGVSALGAAVVAYEPVWAIGTGMTATPDQAQDVHRHIRQVVAGRDGAIAENLLILYGGSVKGDNAAGLFAMPDIDGALVGGASLKAADFLAIVDAAATL